MAINQKDIALKACLQTVKSVTKILEALDELESTQEQISAAGIDLTSYTADIEANIFIRHCGATTYTNILNTFAPYVVAQLKAYYSGSPTQQGWVALQLARYIENLNL